MNWNKAKLSFAAVCAMALAAPPVVAHGANGYAQSGWNSQDNGWNHHGRPDHGNDQNRTWNSPYGYNQNRDYRSRYGENGWNNDNRFGNENAEGRRSNNDGFGYNQYGHNGQNDWSRRQGWNDNR